MRPDMPWHTGSQARPADRPVSSVLCHRCYNAARAARPPESVIVFIQIQIRPERIRPAGRIHSFGDSGAATHGVEISEWFPGSAGRSTMTTRSEPAPRGYGQGGRA